MIKRYRNLPMQKKMMLTFLAPLLAIEVLLCALLVPQLSARYNAQILQSLDLSCNQAASFINSYMDNMEYISRLIHQDRELHSLFTGEPDFEQNTDQAESFRHFVRLSGRLAELESVNTLYRTGVYVPDEFPYSGNRRYIYPLSDLQTVYAPDEFQKKLDQGLPVYRISSEIQNSTTSLQIPTLALYQNLAKLGSGQVLVSKVSIEAQTLRGVLDNADITQSGSLFLVGEQNDVLISSGESLSEENRAMLLRQEELLRQARTPEGTQLQLGGTSFQVLCRDVSDIRHFYLLALIPTDEIRARQREFTGLLIVLGAAFALTTAVASWYLSKYYTSRLVRLKDKMENFGERDLNSSFSPAEQNGSGDEINAIYREFNSMAVQLRHLMQEHYEMGKSVKSAELRALQAQINPHFLYNTLELVNWMSMDYSAPEIGEIVQALATFYRLSLNRGSNLLTIREELRHVQSYVEIENYHFEHAITLTLDVPEHIMDLACPNIILQPLVENSIMHGIAEHPEITECNITIRAREVSREVSRDDNQSSTQGSSQDLIFTIEDDGPGIPDELIPVLTGQTSSNPDVSTEGAGRRSASADADAGRSSSSTAADTDKNSADAKASGGYGVRNINFRLKLYFGEQYGLTYLPDQDQGTTVELRIPALTLEQAAALVD